MADSIVHRGPDDEGFWSNDDVGFAFRRLSIVDLKHGRQPMSDHAGRVWVVFNGEIYNHVSLRRELESLGHAFQTDHSDTEVLIHGWKQWGDRLPERLNGMFAFCIYDDRSRTAFFARDRLGVKPLYLHERDDGAVLFGSEVRPIHASGLLPIEATARGVLEYFSTMNQWGGRTPFKGVRMLDGGSWLKLTPTLRQEHVYWDIEYNRKPEKKLGESEGEFREVLLSSIDRQISADVPVTSYLSGGIDSTAVTVAAYERDPSVRAYSCIFDLDNVGVDRFVDEREFSRAAAQHLSIDRVELELPQDTLTRTLDPTVRALEYPRMGMAYVNYSIAQRVAQDAKVVLSGMGGDEVTGGYIGRYGLIPQAKRGEAGDWIGLDGFKRAPGCPDVDDPFWYYRRMLNVVIMHDQLEDAFTPEFMRAAGGYDPLQQIKEALDKAPGETTWDVLMYVDAKTYLHGLLVLEDKLSMTHSLETRVPLLDNELVDLLLETPWDLLSDGETGKILFREAVRPMVPEAIYTKPKMGFGPPDASWYRGVLRGFLENKLSYAKVEARGVFRPQWVQSRLEEHFNETQNWVSLIWCLISFESWCDQYKLFGGRV